MMALFRRSSPRPADPRPAIAGFWHWWTSHRADVLAAVEGGHPEGLVDILEPAVAAVHPRLDWEIAASELKRFTLVVTSGGNPDVRGIAERWALSAPDDPDVEFAATRRRDPSVLQSGVLTVDDYEVALGELVAGTRVDPLKGKVDVVVHHPLFPLLDENHRAQVVFHGLDAALGEDDAARWLGTVEVSADQPIDAIPLASLGAVVDQLRPAGDQWAALQGAGPRGPILALMRRPFARVDRPLADTHVSIVLPYSPQANGMPDDESVPTEVERLEERVLGTLGGDGPHVVHLGHVTGGGQVVIHYYVDGFEVDPGPIARVVQGWTRGKGAVRVTHDPGWEAVAGLLA
jgi:hypothetical protein